MDATKVQIGLLEGKSNWSTWKYKLCILLRGVKGGTEVLEGKLKAPEPLSADASTEDKTRYEEDFLKFNQADSNALLLLTVNMTQETLEKVMRFTTAREVWLELHRLYDGNVEDKTYDLCMQFFSYIRQADDDIATHTSKLKNLWDKLQKEITKDKVTKGQSETLPADYFSFKSSWMLISNKDRTIDNLTNQLCAYEKALSTKSETKQEVLYIANKSKPNNLFCKYCKLRGHKIKQCEKWKADGKPPKPDKSNRPSGSKNNVSLVAVSNVVLSCENDMENWFVDNGATNHITNQSEVFESYTPFDDHHQITTANGDSVPALGKGTIRVKTNVNGRMHEFSLTEVWYVPNIKKNLFSTLSTQDKNPDSEFVSTAEECQFKLSGEVILVGSRRRSGGLYKLKMRSLKPENLVEINLVQNNNVLQLYHERFGHQNKRYVKTILKREFGLDVTLDSELCEGCIYGKAHVLKFGTRERAKTPGELLHTDMSVDPLTNPNLAINIMSYLKMIIVDSVLSTLSKTNQKWLIS